MTNDYDFDDSEYDSEWSDTDPGCAHEFDEDGICYGCGYKDGT